MTTAFSDSSMASGEGIKENSSKISDTNGRMTMQFNQISSSTERQNRKKFDLNHLVCTLWVSKVQVRSNILFAGYATSEHGNFTKCYRVNNINIRNWP